MSKPPILEEALKITTGDRRRYYGRPLINHARIAIRWHRRLEERQKKGLPLITPSVVAELMVDLKDARHDNIKAYDNLLDTIGYISCIDDMARQFVEEGISDDYENALELLDRLPPESLEALLTRLEKKEGNYVSDSPYVGTSTG